MNRLEGNWISYWEDLDEGQLLFRQEADEYVRNLTGLGIPPGARILDFGCGYGFVAEGLASLVGEVCLWDAAESMRRRAAEALADRPNVRLIDLAEPAGDTRPFDLILVNSVVQYMTPDELASWLTRWQGMLATGGRLVLSDLIPPEHRSLWDVFSLLRFSLRRRYFLRAMRNVLAERKRYREAVQAVPLLRVGRDDLSCLARAVGLGVRFLPRNLTHFSRRYTAILEPPR